MLSNALFPRLAAEGRLRHARDQVALDGFAILVHASWLYLAMTLSVRSAKVKSAAHANATVRRRLVAALTAVLIAAAGPASAASDNCFSANDRPEAGLRVYRLAPPPQIVDQPGYRYWPLDVAGQIGSIARSRAANIGTYAFVWANRCQPITTQTGTCARNPKGNFVLPRYMKGADEVRPFFTSLARANSCTLIQAAHLLGDPAGGLKLEAAAAGIGLVRRSDPLDGYIENGRFIDLCILTDDVLPGKAKGIMLDYEVQDGRTPAENSRLPRQVLTTGARAWQGFLALHQSA